MNLARIRTLIGKELRELRAAPAAILPVAILTGVTTILPFVLILIVPRVTGTSIADDRSLRQIVLLARLHVPGLAALSQEAAAQAFLFQQFVVLFVITPVVGAVSFAAYSVVGEKQGRTLEPLLTTPVTTYELLVSKVIACLFPSLAVEAAALLVYVLLIGVLAPPGVLAAVLTPRTLILVAVVGPLASLAGLQLTIAVSSRVNDARSAQQIAVLLVLPLMVILFGQLAGAFILTSAMLLALSIVLAAIWVVLVMLSVALFERETILTRQ
ncbi:MAG: ABC transporter permease [Vicinamibacterales bacterium]